MSFADAAEREEDRAGRHEKQADEVQTGLTMHRRGGPSLLTIVYLVVGVFVAGDHNYIHHGTVGQVVSALLAIVLWPLILLFNVDLHIR